MDAIPPLIPANTSIPLPHPAKADAALPARPAPARAPAAPEPGVVTSLSGKVQLPVSAASLYQLLAASWEKQASSQAPTQQG
ncbi:MAG: hypothetical protein KGM91_25655 [Burkholderiales bacterium]|nr:hypothetical protein [Burkholderiales bacterium]